MSNLNEFASKASRLRELIEAKKERDRIVKDRQERLNSEEKYQQEIALMSRPGEGIIDWSRIVNMKRQREKDQRELASGVKPTTISLSRDYNCVKHIQDQFIEDKVVTEQMSVTFYRKILPCPLRSQLKTIKNRMFSSNAN